MSDIQNARDRLEQAVARLEHAVDETTAKSVDTSALEALTAERDGLQERLARVEEENQNLVQQLSDMSEQNRALEALTDQIAGRLDSSIDKLKAAMAADS